MERSFILQTLDEVGWKVGGRNGAAAKLGLNRTTLIHKMKSFRLKGQLQSDLLLELLLTNLSDRTAVHPSILPA
jgi:formate hydrogenlyase transcriptional activator